MRAKHWQILVLVVWIGGWWLVSHSSAPAMVHLRDWSNAQTPSDRTVAITAAMMIAVYLALIAVFELSPWEGNSYDRQLGRGILACVGGVLIVLGIVLAAAWQFRWSAVIKAIAVIVVFPIIPAVCGAIAETYKAIKKRKAT